MAWGDGYIRQLFDYALPAVLAPGNLPALIEQFDCEVVVVTSEGWFDALRRHPVYRRIAGLCPIELRPVDEFVNRPDAYGMALTYALFRGFEDLGAAMLDTDLVFFNADFIMADGSLRTLAAKLVAGERLVLSPSYCVVLEDVVPQFAARLAGGGEVLAVPPREMAALALRHRHNTIRGKTVNQRLFSIEWIDQFYWLADERTLLGHQLPIAVVAMRPTRELTEMRTYWDYGIISEACPGVTPCVLGDSDDFLMLELRRGGTARDQLSLGWPTSREIAAKLEKFITGDPVSLARHTLVLHSDELPPDLDRAKAALDAYVDSVLRELPADLTDHVDHPNWVYHYQRFHQARREYLARKRVADAPPAAIDGSEHLAAAAASAELAAEAAIAAPPRRTLAGRVAFAVYRRLLGVAPDLQPWHPRWADVQPLLQVLAALRPRAQILVVASDVLPERLFRNLPATHAAANDIIGAPEASLAEAPAVPAPELAPAAAPAKREPRLLHLRIDGEVPAEIVLSPDAAPRAGRLRSLRLTWQEAEEGRDDDAAAVEPDPPRRAPPALVDDPPVTEEFDLCLCELSADDLLRVRLLVSKLAPRVRHGGSILVLHLNHPPSGLGGERALIGSDALALDLPCRLYFSGSQPAARALAGFSAAISSLRSRRPGALARGAILLARSLLQARRATGVAAAKTDRPGNVVTSLVMEISVNRRAERPAPGAPAERLPQAAK